VTCQDAFAAACSTLIAAFFRGAALIGPRHSAHRSADRFDLPQLAAIQPVGQQSLRAVLGFCNAPQMTSPEAYIQFTPGLITAEGEVTVQSTREFLRRYMTEFHDFVTRVRSALPKD
jgi:hypothetical protein